MDEQDITILRNAMLTVIIINVIMFYQIYVLLMSTFYEYDNSKFDFVYFITV